MKKCILIYLTIFLCFQSILTSCSFSPERPTGIWENEDKTFIIDFADGYNYDDMNCSLSVGEEIFEYDICFAVVEQYVSLGKLSYDENSEAPVFHDEIEFSYSYNKDKLILKVNSSSSECFSSGQEIVLNPLS